jgi:hypothetical protein
MRTQNRIDVARIVPLVLEQMAGGGMLLRRQEGELAAHFDLVGRGDSLVKRAAVTVENAVASSLIAGGFVEEIEPSGGYRFFEVTARGQSWRGVRS